MSSPRPAEPDWPPRDALAYVQSDEFRLLIEIEATAALGDESTVDATALVWDWLDRTLQRDPDWFSSRDPSDDKKRAGNPRFPDQAAWRAYLRKAILNAAARSARRRRREQPLNDLPDSWTPESAEADPGQQSEQHEMEAQLSDALARLSPRQRSIVQLICVQGMTQSEVADRLRISRQTVHAQFERAIEILGRYVGRP